MSQTATVTVNCKFCKGQNHYHGHNGTEALKHAVMAGWFILRLGEEAILVCCPEHSPRLDKQGILERVL